MNLFDIIAEDVSLATTKITAAEERFIVERFGISRREKTQAEKLGRSEEEQAHIERKYAEQADRNGAHDAALKDNDDRTAVSNEKQRKADWKASGRQVENGKSSSKIDMDSVDMPGYSPGQTLHPPKKDDYFRHTTGLYKVIGYNKNKRIVALQHTQTHNTAKIGLDKIEKIKDRDGKSIFALKNK